MRRLIFTSLAVVFVAVSGLAMAASDRHAKGEFVPLAASGVSGQVKLTGQPAKEETNVVLQARGLQNAEYKAVAFRNTNCQPEAESLELGRFKPNPSGMVTWTGKINRNVELIGSISLQLATDETVQACAQVVQQ